MTDKELLVLAAKAAGYNIDHPMNTERHALSVPIIDLWAECDGKLVSTGWNPLRDDGHALRLAVKLKFCLDFSVSPYMHVQYPIGNGYHPMEEDETECPYAATRRAIVRAAVEIGRKL